MLPAQAQRRTTGGQDLQVRADGQQVGHLVGGRQDVFEVVEDEQDVAIEQDAFQAVQQRLVTPLADTKRLGDGGADERGVLETCQIDEEHTVGEDVQQRLGHRQRQTRLARAGWPGERHQAHVVAQQHLAGKLQLTSSTNDLGRLGTQVVLSATDHACYRPRGVRIHRIDPQAILFRRSILVRSAHQHQCLFHSNFPTRQHGVLRP